MRHVKTIIDSIQGGGWKFVAYKYFCSSLPPPPPPPPTHTHKAGTTAEAEPPGLERYIGSVCSFFFLPIKLTQGKTDNTTTLPNGEIQCNAYLGRWILLMLLVIQKLYMLQALRGYAASGKLNTPYAINGLLENRVLLSTDPFLFLW